MKGIYKITNVINGKVYIGQSQNLINRKNNHFYWLGRNEHHNEYLQKAYNKYGEENFIFEVLEESDDLYNRELHWVNEYGGVNSKLNYNLKNPLTNEFSDYVKIKQSKNMLGKNNPNYGNRWDEEKKKKLSEERKGKTLEERIGKEKAELAKQKMSKSQTGRKHPKEVKEKIRQANIGENNPAYGKGYRQLGEKNPMWGKHLSNEAKDKLRQFHLGKVVSDETRKKMSESAKNRKKLISEEVKEKIRQANIGENNPAYGKGYRQLGKNNPMWGKPCSTRKPIQCFTKEGVLVKEYDFISQVKEDGFNPSNVMYCARGVKKYKTSGGFIWKFKE
jgi:group I intron endonuclease